MPRIAPLIAALALAAVLGACATPPPDPDDATKLSVCGMVHATMVDASTDETATVEDVTGKLDAAGVMAASMDDQHLMEVIADLSVAVEMGDMDGSIDAARRFDEICNAA